jgi:hypothetical protein
MVENSIFALVRTPFTFEGGSHPINKIFYFCGVRTPCARSCFPGRCAPPRYINISRGCAPPPKMAQPGRYRCTFKHYLSNGPRKYRELTRAGSLNTIVAVEVRRLKILLGRLCKRLHSHHFEIPSSAFRTLVDEKRNTETTTTNNSRTGNTNKWRFSHHLNKDLTQRLSGRRR